MNAERIFDAFDELSRLTHLKDRRRIKLSEIRDCEARVCGNCNWWMKNECKPEKEYGEFKSSRTVA